MPLEGAIGDTLCYRRSPELQNRCHRILRDRIFEYLGTVEIVSLRELANFIRSSEWFKKPLTYQDKGTYTIDHTGCRVSFSVKDKILANLT